MDFVMSPGTELIFEKERRSSRAFLRAKIVAAGKNNRGKKFRLMCETVVVSAHGCLFCIGQEVEMGSVLTVTSPFTHEEQECRVVYIGQETQKGCRIGIEFLTPAPRFWGMEFALPVNSAMVSPN
jgi:PilZ domain